MEILKNNATYGFSKNGKIFFALSLAAILFSIFLIIAKGLPLGIDFAGGTVVQVKYDKAPDLESIRSLLSKNTLFEKSIVTKFGSDEEILIRIPTAIDSVQNDIGDIASSLLKESGNFEVRRVDMVGPKVGDKLKTDGILSLVLASIAIMIYVSIRYEWRFALASIFALFHDVVFSVGAIILFQIDLNLDVVAALLTIIGYSINDTIIVFDRIREVIRNTKLENLEEIIDESVSRTLSRTLLTSLTVFFVVLTLYLFGGEIIHGFSFTLLIGVVVGTYSSIYIASYSVSLMRFSVAAFRQKEAEALKRKAEKDRMRAMYEKGIV